MNLTVKFLAIAIILGVFTSCSDPLDYQDVQKQKRHAESGVIETPNGYTEAVVLGVPEKLSSLESIQANLSEARVAVMLKGEADTIYAGILSEQQGLWLFPGDNVFVHNDKLTILRMNALPTLANGEIVSVNSMLGEVVSVDVLMGNRYTPVMIYTTQADIPDEEFQIGRFLTIENGHRAVGVLD